MLGQTIKQQRARKGLTQARLARMAGVSRRHLAALENGANVSVGILQRVAAVLELTEIPLGGVALRASDPPKVNLPLVADAIREARADAERANAVLARAEHLLGGASAPASASFPHIPVRRLSTEPLADGSIHERPELQEVETAGELRQGRPIDATSSEPLALPKSLVDDGEVVYRFRGDGAEEHGIVDGDLLVVELRPSSRAATGELVLARTGDEVWIGHWWQKRGGRELRSNGMSRLATGRGPRALKVIGAVNQILRGR